jgi:hypothetical protein
MSADLAAVELLAEALVYWNDSSRHGWHRLNGVYPHHQWEPVALGAWLSTPAFVPDPYILLAFLEVEHGREQARRFAFLPHVFQSPVLTHAF